MTNTNRSHLRIRALCEGAVMVALAQALSHVKFMTLPNGGSLTPALFPILFFGMFALIVVMFVVTLARGAVRWRRNNASPVLTVEAGVVAKRTQVSRSAGADHDMMGGFTSYYATFEVESGSRMELAVSGEEYGMPAEGDRGRLTFQGTRYKGFERA